MRNYINAKPNLHSVQEIDDYTFNLEKQLQSCMEKSTKETTKQSLAWWSPSHKRIKNILGFLNWKLERSRNAIYTAILEILQLELRRIYLKKIRELKIGS